MEDNDLVLAVDLGGSKFIVGYVDGEGRVVASRRHLWEDRREGALVGQVACAARALAAEEPQLAGRVRVGGVTIPGFADAQRGIWVDSDNLDVHDLPICDLLERELGVAFFGDNDCNACGLAEARFGGARGASRLLYLTVSSGVGGCTLLDHRLYYGWRGLSGEIGLTVSERGGRPSLSGNTLGPLEAYCSTEGIARTYAELGGPVEVGGHPLGGKEVARAAQAGDGAALEAIRLEGLRLGRQIARAVAVMAPTSVVLGGGMSLMFDAYAPALRQELSRVLPGADVAVSATSLGYEGALLGAAACGLRGLEGWESPLGQGPKGSCELVVGLAGGHLAHGLVVDGRNLLEGSAATLGDYLDAAGASDEGSSLGSLLASADLPALVERAASGDAVAISCLLDAGHALGRALAFSCVLLDPAVVRLAGDLAGMAPWLEGPIRQELFEGSYYPTPEEVPYRLAFGEGPVN